MDYEEVLDLYEDAPCGFLSVAPDGQIVRINHTLTDWLGERAVVIPGTRIHDVLSVGGKIAYETHIVPLLRMQGFVHEIALDLLDQDGKRIPFIANASERRSPEGEHLSTRFALFRATDRRAYEHALLQARTAAETAALREKETALLREQFIAVLGHDLRNPLAAIISGVRVLKRSASLDARGTMIIDEMERSTGRALALINDVLDFARGRLGDGLVASRAEQHALEPVLTQVIGEIRAIVPDRQIGVTMSIDHPVYCDAERIGQLLSNLLSNAVTHGDPQREVRVDAWTDGENFKLDVTNFGPAIPGAALEKLFQPFFRANVRESREGLGLGLFIVQEVAKAHSGLVTIKSDEAATVFSFIMPLHAD